MICQPRLEAKNLPKELRRGLPQGLQPGQPFFAILPEVVDEFRFGKVGIDEKFEEQELFLD